MRIIGERAVSEPNLINTPPLPSRKRTGVETLVGRTIRSSLVATAILCPFILVHFGNRWALGFALASLWNIVNVGMISFVVREFLGPRRWRILIPLFAIKFPLLYGLGIWGLQSRTVPIGSILVGFHIIFIVLILKALSYRVLEIQHPPSASPEEHGAMPGSEERI